MRQTNDAVERINNMRKLFTVFTAFILALNVNLFAQPFAYAASDQYNNIANGTYTITAKALNADSNEPSGAAGFINESAQLKISDTSIQLVLTVPKHEMASITGMQIAGGSPTINGDKWTYTLAKIQPIVNAKVQYEVPSLNMKHDVPFRFALSGLDQLPEKEAPEVVEPEVEAPEKEEPEKEEKPESDKNDSGTTENEKEEPTKEESEKEEEPDKPTTDNDANKEESLKNGAYTAEAAYLHASKDEASSMGRYLSNSVFVSVQNDGIEMTVTINDHKTVTALKVNGKNATSTKVDGNKRYETFKVDQLEKAMTAYVEYEAPYGGSVHKGNASFRISVDPQTLKETSATNKPGNDVPGEAFKLADGLYAVDASYINAKNGGNSAMARYLGKQAYISVKDGKAEVYFAINDNETVTKLKVNNQSVIEEVVNGETTLAAFSMQPLVAEMTGYAEYQAPFNGDVHYGQAEFTIALNEATVEKITKLPIENEQPKEEEKEKEESTQPSVEEKPKQENSNTTVKGYSIDYTIQHATKDEASAADEFFVKPGTLLKKDGKNYLQISINNWRMIDWLKVSGQSVIIIEEDKAADTALVQFQVPNNLNDIAEVTMKVTVLGLYETTHDARLVLDAKSLVADDSGKDYVVHAPTTDENEPTINKPSFGSNGTTNTTTRGQATAGAQENPQTGDTSQLILYTTLLIGSVLLLAVQYRRRRIHS